MRVKSSVLFGLIALLCVISGVSVYKQLREVHDSWQPSDMYTGLKGMRSRTYSSVSYGNGASSDAPVLSLGARSMSGYNAAFSYAHAPASPVVSMGSTSSYGQSAVAGGNLVYATSNAEVRSFGGGGNGGGSVSMSGGVAKSSGSGAGSSVSLGVSTPSVPILAVNNNRNTNNQILPNISGEVVANPVATYAGIGNTTGGTSRGLSGRKGAAPTFNDPWWKWFDSWVSDNGSDYGYNEDGSYIFDRYDLQEVYQAFLDGYWNSGMGDAPSFEQWLDWYQQAMLDGGGSYGYNGHKYFWQPIGDIWPLFVMILLYASYLVVHRRKQTAIS
jgi:hypothetical protein